MKIPLSLYGLQLAALLFLLCSTITAQGNQDSIRGVITDPDGRPVADATISLTQDSIGLLREVRSNAAGLYVLAELPLGDYAIAFSAPGFAGVRFASVNQAIGQERTLNVSLKIANGAESVEVQDAIADLDRTSNALGTRFERKQVIDLPLNGRNWANLTALTAGAVDAGGSNQRTIRFAGRGLDDNNFTFDGIDATNILNQAQQSFVRLAIPTDAIREFQVQSMLFSADSGTPGGQLAVASGSGANEFHGNAFDYLRNDIFDARAPNFDFSANPVPAPHLPFRLNQFGGSVGGAIVHDRTFFYLTYEGLRQTLGQNLNGIVPGDTFRAQVATQSPALAFLVAAYPVGTIVTSANLCANCSQFLGRGTQLDHENSAMLRLDQRFTSKTTAFLRFNVDEAVSEAPLGSSAGFLGDRQQVSSRPVNGVIDLLHIFSPALVNDAKFGFNRSTAFTANDSLTGLAYSLAVSGFTTLNNNQARTGVGNSFSWLDNITWTRGRHLLKFGGEIRRIQLDQGNGPSGTISYSSQATFRQNQVSSANYAAALPENGLRKTEFSGSLQDEYRWRENVTFNLGLRYQIFNRFSEVYGRAIPFDFASCGPQGFCPAGAEFSRPNLGDIDPRVAVAWAPKTLGDRTVLRAGFGLYHGDGQLDDQNLPISNEVARYSLAEATIPALSYPITPFLGGTKGIVSPRDMDRARKDMYVSQWGASVQQSLPEKIVGTVSYIGSKGTHLLTVSYINLIDPVTGLRPYSGFGQVEFRGNNSDSAFEGLQLSLHRSFDAGLALAANYLWSHEIDNDSLGGGDADFPANPGCIPCERASGDYDARHAFNANAIYQLPFGEGRFWLHQPGLARAIFGSWELTSIVSGRTGLPVNVTVDRSTKSLPNGDATNQRPDRVPGVPLTPAGGSSIAQWINPVAFTVPAPGTHGNAGRNLVRAPGLWQADLGMSKRIHLAERAQLQFRAEAFNVFNRGQYGVPSADISANTFGRIGSTVNTGPTGTGTPRQIQFMMRVDF